jgi:hypothetical protein
MLDPITVEVTVNTDRDAAFMAFVANICDWWPMAPFSMSQGMLHFEQKLGGLIVETSSAGEKFVWGHVTAWDKPNGLELAWYVGSTADTATQIVVTFAAVEEKLTLVTLVQSGWEALGDNAAEIRQRNNGGWRSIVGEHFVAFVDAEHIETLNEVEPTDV